MVAVIAIKQVDKFRKKSHEELTMDDIRDMFGSQRYEQKKEEEKKLQAAI